MLNIAYIKSCKCTFELIASSVTVLLRILYLGAWRTELNLPFFEKWSPVLLFHAAKSYEEIIGFVPLRFIHCEYTSLYVIVSAILATLQAYLARTLQSLRCTTDLPHCWGGRYGHQDGYLVSIIAA